MGPGAWKALYPRDQDFHAASLKMPTSHEADCCMQVSLWHWWMLPLDPSASPMLTPHLYTSGGDGRCLWLSLHQPFTIHSDCLSSLPAKQGKPDLWPLGAGNICTFTIFNPKPRSCFYVLLNCEPSEDEVLQTGVMLLHEIGRKLFASTG